MAEKEPFKMKPWQYYVKYGLAIIAAAAVAWPLMGWLLAKGTGEEFVYDYDIYLLRPVIFGVLLGLYNYHVDSNRAN
ncbi:MAG: hypothetical protein IJM63_11545 [Solobacterium sp.]|nr:hypothetical protein [Solobacterium sp.]MBQ9825125.1 hypothetical protein [Solobacterium sp.]